MTAQKVEIDLDEGQDNDVDLQNDQGNHDNQGDQGDDQSSEVDGAVSGVTSACPTLSFTVKGTTVTTSSQTTYSGGSCADIKVGVSLEVTGLVQPDKSLAAARVTIEKSGSGK